MVVGSNRRVRFGFLGLVCLGVFAALFARLWYLQVLNAPAYQQVATMTSTRTVRIPAPRGRILDRHGKVLVDNVPTKVVAIDRQKLDEASNPDAVLSRVAALLNHFEKPETPYTVASIKKDLAVNRVGPFDPVPLAQNVSEPLLVEMIEHSSDYPGVVAETRLLRQYHYGNLAAQVLGRVGSIPEEVWKAHEDDEDPYAKDAQVGLSGVEQSMEKYLRGTDGERVVEVTPAGKVVRTVKSVAPVPGDDVQLTIDINAQARTEAALAQQVEAARKTPRKLGYPPVPGAAAMMMDPKTGQVISMASYPTYDPAMFVPAISEKDWKTLQAPEAESPLTNRSDGGLYSPGSTFKLITATAGLRTGIITPHSTYVDTGEVRLPGCGDGCVFTNDAGDGALGPIQLPRAITQSSNVYFFNIGQKLWEGRGRYGDAALQKTASDYGFGELTGLDLPDEKAVPLPTPERRAKMAEENPALEGQWYTGTNLNLAIGQGDLLVTPLQLANSYAQFANHGDRYKPTVLLRVLKHFAPLDDDGAPEDPSDVLVDHAPEKIGHITYEPSWYTAIMQGLTGVTQSTSPRGTASDAFQGFPFDKFSVAGKTGTAQTTNDKFSNSLFVGFGPTEDAQLVGVAVLEQAGYGSRAAAPVVRAMFEPYADAGSWPTVEPTIPLAAPLSPSGSTVTTTTVPGGGQDETAPTSTTVVTGQSIPDTAETTTPGAVAGGGR